MQSQLVGNTEGAHFFYSNNPVPPKLTNSHRWFFSVRYRSIPRAKPKDNISQFF